jgi:hypothetical protein
MKYYRVVIDSPGYDIWMAWVDKDGMAHLVNHSDNQVDVNVEPGSYCYRLGLKGVDYHFIVLNEDVWISARVGYLTVVEDCG